MTNNSRRSYSELIKLKTFEERFKYLKLNGIVGSATFGNLRRHNQILYNSYKWRKFRNEIILRDNGCDLGIFGEEIGNIVIIHHINPLSVEDVLNNSFNIYDPDNVICVSHKTHEAIHYGDENSVKRDVFERTPNDTSPWKKNEDMIVY